MGLDASTQAAIALHRFGLGPRPGSIAALAADPRGALLAELDRPDAGLINPSGLMSSAEAARAGFEARAERRAQQLLAQRAAKEGDGKDAQMKSPATPSVSPVRTIERETFLKEIKTRLDAALAAEIGLVERLVWFWSNHFCISANKVPNMAGGYEREAVRPHVLGRFESLLLAVEGHPAMLAYLDNSTSIGPNSVAGINRARGLNENLAREILELHTLGVDAGYTQEDVTSLARILTGWTVVPINGNPEHGGTFVFNRRLHEPGSHRVLAKTYPDSGVEQGRSVLKDLVRHEATVRHMAAKLVRHFLADEAPPALIDRLAATFRETDGNLKEVARTLVAAPEAWEPPLRKLKRPSEWVVAMLRATGVSADPARFVRGQMLLGEPVWRPPAPKGFADDAASWLDGIGQRLDIANSLAERMAGRADPRDVLETALGPLTSRQTRLAVERAESRSQALAIVFMAPEFLRR